MWALFQGGDHFSKTLSKITVKGEHARRLGNVCKKMSTQSYKLLHFGCCTSVQNGAKLKHKMPLYRLFNRVSQKIHSFLISLPRFNHWSQMARKCSTLQTHKRHNFCRGVRANGKMVIQIGAVHILRQPGEGGWGVGIRKMFNKGSLKLQKM